MALELWTRRRQLRRLKPFGSTETKDGSSLLLLEEPAADPDVDDLAFDLGVLRSTSEIAKPIRPIENPVGYCLAVGGRLQDEAGRLAGGVQSEQRWWIENACRHGALDVEVCPSCAEDLQRAFELFPSLRRFLSNSTDSSGLKRGRT
jgi:hypothetical protein